MTSKKHSLQQTSNAYCELKNVSSIKRQSSKDRNRKQTKKREGVLSIIPHVERTPSHNAFILLPYQHLPDERHDDRNRHRLDRVVYDQG
jgi:hypothetical protein